MRPGLSVDKLKKIVKFNQALKEILTLPKFGNEAELLDFMRNLPDAINGYCGIDITFFDNIFTNQYFANNSMSFDFIAPISETKISDSPKKLEILDAIFINIANQNKYIYDREIKNKTVGAEQLTITFSKQS